MGSIIVIQNACIYFAVKSINFNVQCSVFSSDEMGLGKTLQCIALIWWVTAICYIYFCYLLVLRCSCLVIIMSRYLMYSECIIFLTPPYMLLIVQCAASVAFLAFVEIVWLQQCYYIISPRSLRCLPNHDLQIFIIHRLRCIFLVRYRYHWSALI